MAMRTMFRSTVPSKVSNRPSVFIVRLGLRLEARIAICLDLLAASG